MCALLLDQCSLINLSMNPTDVFTRRNGPAEFSLHSSISCCLTFASGQQLGSLDSNGSITYTTHTRTHTREVTVKTIQRGDDWWSVYEKHTVMCNDNQPGGAFMTWDILSSRWSHMLLKEMEQCAAWTPTLESCYSCSSSFFYWSNSIRQSWKEWAFTGMALRE